MTGSPALERAIVWAHDAFVADGQENVALDPVRVPIWSRGKESAEIVAPQPRRLALLGLGGSVGTPPGGVTAEVVAVSSFDELAKLGASGSALRGKIVLFNHPFPTKVPNAAAGYGASIEYRLEGATRAAALGASAVLVRSLASASLGAPHTGAMKYGPGPKIPTAALSVEDAELVARLAARGPVTVHLELEDGPGADAPSFNVLAELRGSEQPEEIVVVSAHIDSWDVGQGAQDDGAGVAIVMESLATLRRLGLVPRRTIRAVLFTNEETGAAAARATRRRTPRSLPATSPPSRPTSAPDAARLPHRRRPGRRRRAARPGGAGGASRRDERRHRLFGLRHQRHAPRRRAALGPLLRPGALLRRAPLGRRHARQDRPAHAGPQRRGNGDDGLRSGRPPNPLARLAAANSRAQAVTAPGTDAARARAASRLAALDWMRGLVMVLMAIDHSSDAFNGGRLFTDAAFRWHPGTPLPAAQFLTRWVTHLCAPTFLFLAGTSLAFTVSRQVQSGDRPSATDRYILVRGLVIAAFELWISLTVMGHGRFIFQVLYGIGSAYICMIPLRRLSDRAAPGVALFLIATSELMVGLAMRNGPPTSLLPQLLLTGGQRARLIIAYPTVHWLALLLLGWSWGRRLVTAPHARATAGRDLARAGVAALVLFVVLRGIDGYGNMRLFRDSLAPLQWLHVSKYPPSITYDALELGLMALILSAMFRLARDRTPSPNSLFMVLGQTPMFFYLLHFPLLVAGAKLLGVQAKLGLGAAYLGAAAVVALLYPVCRWYRGYKSAHRTGWPKYI